MYATALDTHHKADAARRFRCLSGARELHVDDSELLASCVRANQLLWSDGRYERAREFTNELAAALRKKFEGVTVYATALDADHEADAARAASDASS